MKKFIVAICCILFCCIPLFYFTACAGTKPVTKIEFESTSEIVLDSPDQTASFSLYVYPANANTSNVTLKANKDGYFKIEERLEVIAVGQPYRILKFTISPLYNGSITVSAIDAFYNIEASTSIQIKIVDIEEKPITDSEEISYLTSFGWNQAMIDSFVYIRKSINLSPVKEIISTDNQTCTFINGKSDTCKVIFEKNAVSEIYDCMESRRIFPTKGENIIYADDIDTTLKLNLMSLAENVVESFLYSPSSAEFPFFDWTFLLDTSSTNCIYISSYVDSDNLFGVSVRNRFVIKIKCPADSSPDWTALLLDDKYYFNEDLI